MLFAEGQRFLLDLVTRSCPYVECKHLHILYGYIPVVDGERILLQKNNFCNIDYVLYCCDIYVKYHGELQKMPLSK